MKKFVCNHASRMRQIKKSVVALSNHTGNNVRTAQRMSVEITANDTKVSAAIEMGICRFDTLATYTLTNGNRKTIVDKLTAINARLRCNSNERKSTIVNVKHP